MKIVHLILLIFMLLIKIEANMNLQVKHYGNKAYYTLTAYTAGMESTGKTKESADYGITASGKVVKENHTIACPPILKFGTKIYIASLDRIYTCEDRGAAIKGQRIDIYMEDVSDAYEFGVKRNEEIYLLTYIE